jgi:hypothetical protein
MKKGVKELYGMKGYPNETKFAEFKADFFGTYTSPKTITSVANTYYMAVEGYVKTATNASGAGLIGGYFKARNTANTAGVQLVGAATRVTIGGNVLDAYGIQSHLLVDIGSFSAGTANVVAASFKNTYTGNITATCNVLLLTSEGAGTVTGEKNIMCMDATTAVTNGIMVYGTANITNFLHFGAIAGCVVANTATSAATHAIKISLNGVAKYIRLFDVS